MPWLRHLPSPIVGFFERQFEEIKAAQRTNAAEVAAVREDLARIQDLLGVVNHKAEVLSELGHRVATLDELHHRLDIIDGIGHRLASIDEIAHGVNAGDLAAKARAVADDIRADVDTLSSLGSALSSLVVEVRELLERDEVDAEPIPS